MKVGLQYIPRLRELDAAIEIANAYIMDNKSLLRSLLEDEKLFDQALKMASSIKISSMKLERQTFARTIVDKKHFEIQLNEQFCERFRVLKKEHKNGDEWIVLSYFFGLVLFHEYAHCIVRFKTPIRSTPRKLRMNHRGRLMDAGHTIEVKLFNGILKLVEIKGVDFLDPKKMKFRNIILEENLFPHYLREAHMDRLKKAYESREAVICIFTEDSPIYVPSENEQILDSVVTNVEEPLYDDEKVIQIESEEDRLRKIGLDPEIYSLIQEVCEYEKDNY
jgi:hypothetical protein